MKEQQEEAVKDYGPDGIDIQTAMLRHAKANPDIATRSRCIQWNGVPVWTGYEISVPISGKFKIAFLSEPRRPPQGVDVKAENGTIELSSGDKVQTLRTWHEPQYENVVEYLYKSSVGLLKVWNVYWRHWPDGRAVEEKWTGNSGFQVEKEGESSWIFRCSSGMPKTPNFGELVFRLTVIELSDR